MGLSSAVTNDQFIVRSEMEALHIPTGAIFHAYPYVKSSDMLQSVTVSWGRAGTPSDTEYVDRIRGIASQLLLERLCQADRNHRLGITA
ncbi:MAG: hypothetical protein U1E81_18415 [Xanthobacteraceae bacterium]